MSIFVWFIKIEKNEWINVLLALKAFSIPFACGSSRSIYSIWIILINNIEHVTWPLTTYHKMYKYEELYVFISTYILIFPCYWQCKAKTRGKSMQNKCDNEFIHFCKLWFCVSLAKIHSKRKKKALVDVYTFSNIIMIQYLVDEIKRKNKNRENVTSLCIQS